jgi:hypothetical protein
MALTYTAIQTVKVGSGGSADIEFTSIPDTYTDLLILISAKTTRTGTDKDDELRLRFNGDTGNNYYTTMIERSDSSVIRSVIDAVGGHMGRGTAPTDNAAASTFGNTEYYIANYRSSTAKSVFIDSAMETTGTVSYNLQVGGEWTGTAAITSAKITTVSGTFDQYSTATLYGVLKA